MEKCECSGVPDDESYWVTAHRPNCRHFFRVKRFYLVEEENLEEDPDGDFMRYEDCERLRIAAVGLLTALGNSERTKVAAEKLANVLYGTKENGE